MKLERLESIPDEVDKKLFKPLVVLPASFDDAHIQAEFQKLLLEILDDDPEAIVGVEAGVGEGDAGRVRISGFAVLNTLFRYFVPGHRLMVTEGPNEPRRIWVCKEVE